MGFPMSIVAPKERQHLSADALFHLVRSGFATMPDPRCDDVDRSFTDALMAAFAMFSRKAPARLALDKERAEGTVHTVYGMERVPCDTPMRAILDPVSPQGLRPVCKSILRQLQRGKALEAMAFLDGHSVLALDGTGYFSSTTMHGASCWHTVHRNGSVTYAHQRLGAAIIHPAMRAVIPLMPDPIGQHDGTGKNACERHAAKRFIIQRRQDHPHLQGLVTDDSLRSPAPHIETLHHPARHSILGGTEGDHAFLFQQVPAAEHAGRVTYDARHDRAAGLVHRCWCVNDVPLHASTVEVRVNCIAYGEMRQDKVHHCRWVTDLRVSRRNVLHLMRGGRARWKSAHETCTTLQNQGDHFAHPYGHGEQHLSVVFAMLMMLAFVVDQTPQRCCALVQAVWAKLGSTRLLGERMSAWLYDSALESMGQLCEALLYGFKKSSPLVAIEASSSLSLASVTSYHQTR